MSLDTSLILALAVPATGAALIPWLGRWPNLRETVTIITSFALRSPDP